MSSVDKSFFKEGGPDKKVLLPDSIYPRKTFDSLTDEIAKSGIETFFGKRVGSKGLIRDINERIVLEEIIEKAPVSRADLSKISGLTKATISSIVQTLIDRGLVIETGSGDTVIGRKPTLINLNRAAGSSLSLDLRKDKISLLAADLSGAKLFKKDLEPIIVNESDITRTVIAFIESCVRLLPETKYGVIGISIAIHGIVNKNTFVFSPHYKIPRKSFVKDISDYFGAPVTILNDANLGALGEKTFSKRSNNIAFLEVNEGIGLGLFIGGRLYTGMTGGAGEIGHTSIEHNGRPCLCGNRGCLEKYASVKALLEELACKKGQEKVTFHEFLDLYEKGDSDAMYITDAFAGYMATTVTNIINMCNPEVIILNCAFTWFYPEILEKIKAKMPPMLNPINNLCLSRFRNCAILLGGAYVNIVNFLKIENFKPPLAS